MPKRFLKAEDLPNDPDKLVELYKEQVSYLHFDRNKQKEIQDKLGSLKDPGTGEEVSIWEYSERHLTEDQKIAKDALIDFVEYEEIDWSNIKLIRMEAFILELELPKDEFVDRCFSEGEEGEKNKRKKPSYAVNLRRHTVEAVAESFAENKDRNLDERTCKELDRLGLPIPPSWKREYEINSWLEGYKQEKVRGLIQPMFSKYRKKKPTDH